MTPAQANAEAARRSTPGYLPSRDEVLAKGTQLPDLKLDLHVYAEKPAERFVFINMRKLREGESLPDGVRVDAITPRGADLSFRGTRFSLK
jgi:general secretion pathway protein B